jgi:hypothetical protein
MSPEQSIATTRDDTHRNFTGRRIPRFNPGPAGPQISSARDMNVIVDALNSLLNLQIKRGEIDDVMISDSNALIQVAQFTPSSGGSGGASVSMFKLQSVQGDYITSHTWDGSTEGGTDIYIAKDPKHRESLTSESIFGTTHDYTYSAGPDSLNRYRTDDDGTRTQKELLTPPWVGGEIVYAVSATTGVLVGGEDVGRLLISPARQWAKSGDLALVTGTPASATGTTDGYDAGLVKSDNDYIYVSTGVDTWKRVAIATWP